LLAESASLPLQASETPEAPLTRGDSDTPTPYLVEERLRRIDPLHTTPFEALQLLHELRELMIHGATADQPASRAPR
jgi:hypothetical protein